jgi:GH15 family glucan-1,4-alpha-glucosidase
LETTFKGPTGEARLIDCTTIRAGGAREPYRQLLRMVEGVRGWLRFHLRIAPRLDYGEVEPWLRRRAIGAWTVMGGNDGLLIATDVDLDREREHQLAAWFSVRAGQRVHLSIQYQHPEDLDRPDLGVPTTAELDRRLQDTIEWWRAWSSRMVFDSPDAPAANRSAIVLKGLQDAHRRDHRPTHDQPAGDAGWGAQLGLPLQLGAGLGVHRPLAGGARPRGRTGRVPTLHRAQRGRAGRGPPATDRGAGERQEPESGR